METINPNGYGLRPPIEANSDEVLERKINNAIVVQHEISNSETIGALLQGLNGRYEDIVRRLLSVSAADMMAILEIQRDAWGIVYVPDLINEVLQEGHNAAYERDSREAAAEASDA